MPDIDLSRFTEELAQPTPSPGGGSAAAAAGAMAAALVTMVAKVGQARATEPRPDLVQMAEAAERLRGRLLDLAVEDARSYRAVVEARRRPAGTEIERRERDAALAGAWRTAITVPGEVVQACAEVAALARRGVEGTSRSAAPDAMMAALLAAAAAGGSHLNMRLNLAAAGRPEALRVKADLAEVALRETQRAAAAARQALETLASPRE